ncbi:protein MID1-COMPLEMENTING ACTIVITY 1 isoform X2 [Vitis vinifera]|uniref:protein MID1-COMPLEMENTING ACTIVITY 1 isoform X2 n=1 Tax=Vitis vinifera TaxID=29760 RepID=UPI00053FBE73|nr:protein MID1-COMPLEMENTING ACTIVITY 1 isoform X2 [Vitis vinifera]|eukprot:XP_010658232.1 PREDICTED: protein MID1-COMPLEMENTING ACTIVITY 1 isoform X2 [Vitis vinifera]
MLHRKGREQSHIYRAQCPIFSDLPKQSQKGRGKSQQKLQKQKITSFIKAHYSLTVSLLGFQIPRRRSEMEDVAQAAGVDALSVIGMVAAAARKANTHRRNCEKISNHARMIGNLLEKLNATELRSFPATGEPLHLLEEALRKALVLVESCRDRSYLYLLAMGWSIVYQFRRVQDEIDRYLKLVPLISMVHDRRIQEGLQAIEADHGEYTLDGEDMMAQNVILKRDRTKKDADVLEKSLSRRYPDLRFHEALQEEKEKLQIELHRSQVDNDPKQCLVIEHLIEVTQNVVNVPGEKLVDAHAYIGSGYEANAKSCHGGHGSQPEDQDESEWQADLFGCCREPCLSLKTCFYPCGIFSFIANVVSKGKISRERACNELMTYSLFCGCCCYTCCVRRNLRKHFNIEGGSCDDFLTHLMCCCCAMVQERRELELRNFDGCQGRKMIPPPFQYMKP